MLYLTKGKTTAALTLVTALAASAPAVAAPNRLTGSEPSQSASASVQPASPAGGFDWGDAGIGAAGMLGLVGAVGVTAVTARRASGRRVFSAGRT
jgi:hypothetical protein